MAVRTLEIRVNSIQDAQSMVQNQLAISRACKDGMFDGISVKVAKEMQWIVMPIIVGVLGRNKVFHSFIVPDDGSELFVLPPLVVPEPPSNRTGIELPEPLDALGLEELKELKKRAIARHGQTISRIMTFINLKS